MKRYTLLLIGVLLALVALVGGAAMPVDAAFPGINGKIAFVTNRTGDFDIYTMHADGTAVTRMTEGRAQDFNPVWSPNGLRIAFTRVHLDNSMGIYVMNADGSGQQMLFGYPTYEGDGNPTWSPDGMKIAFDCRCGNASGDIYVMNADGSGLTQLTQGAGDPTWSPDGTKIAFVSDRADGNNMGIYVMNADGSDLTMLTNDDDYAPGWSPDGTKIVFVTERHQNVNMNDEIYVMNPDGSQQTRLTYDDALDSYPAWSPDGTKITFARLEYGTGTFDIFTMNVDGSEQSRVTTYGGYDFHPDWQAKPVNTFFFAPTNDAFVTQAHTRAIYGTKPVLKVNDAARDMNTYLKYNVSEVSGSVQSATLRLWVNDPGPDGGQVYATSPFYKDTTKLWLETGLRWNNAPPATGAALDAVGNAVKGQWVDLDVTSAVVAALVNNGRVSLLLTNDYSNLVTYSSKEGLHPPELVIVTSPE